MIHSSKISDLPLFPQPKPNLSSSSGKPTAPSVTTPLGMPAGSLNVTPEALKLSLPKGAGVSIRNNSEVQKASPLIDPERLLAELAENRAKWDNFWAIRDSKHYKFNWSKFCFCKDPSFRGPFTVEVNHEDFKVTWKESGDLATKYNSDIRPMEGIFDSISGILRRHAKTGRPHAMTVTYDEKLGYPTGINIKWSEFGTDDLNTITIDNLEVLP